jgi:GT2 family glycosyltransferase
MLSAIIVAYRTPSEVAAAVASLRAQTDPPDEIVVVDNGAADGDPLPELAELAELEGVTIRTPERNIGYGAGCNLGAQAVSGDDLLMMNADVVLTAGATAALTERLHSDVGIAVVGPRIFSHGEVQLSARAFPSLKTGLFGRRSLLTRILVRAQRYPTELRPAWRGSGRVDWVSGACMLVRRSAFEAVNGFDEGYWMYWEDADLCRRLDHEGWQVHFEPASVVHHATGASGVSARTIRAFHESAARFATRHIARSRAQQKLIEAVLRARARFVLRTFTRSERLREETPTRVLRVIARLNVGGPSIQTIALSRHLEDRGYETRLVRGRENPREGSMDPLAKQLGVRPIDLPSLRRDIGLGDPAALLFLMRQLREWQPEILHTHAAKAGTLARVAALLSGRRPPVIVHTFHGHVLSGYFSPLVSKAFIAIERTLAHFTTCIVAVSNEVRDDLVRLRIAPPDRIVVIPLGFDFAGYDVPDAERRLRRAAVRRSLEIPDTALVVTLVARLEPIKRVDRFLRIAGAMDGAGDTRFLVIGDGKMREKLQGSLQAKVLGERLIWAGLRNDMPDVYFASDVVAVTSDNEGTAVSAIEAHAAGLPVVSTRVGGMASVVTHGETGLLVEPEDESRFAAALEEVLHDAALRRRLGRNGSDRALTNFSLERLVGDVDTLYRRLLIRRRHELPMSS